MWIFTNFGFFSVVQNYKNSEMFVVRARSRGDLESLIAKYGNNIGVTTNDINTSDHTDYRYRIHVQKDQWTSAMSLIISDIDYTNFKDSVHDKMGIERAGLCSKVWSVMYSLQTKEKCDNGFTVLKVR